MHLSFDSAHNKKVGIAFLPKVEVKPYRAQGCEATAPQERPAVFTKNYNTTPEKKKRGTLWHEANVFRFSQRVQPPAAAQLNVSTLQVNRLRNPGAMS